MDMMRVFDKSKNIPPQNKRPLSKLKELKLEVMQHDKKNRKVLDQLMRTRIENTEYLKFFSSSFKMEKKKKNNFLIKNDM